MRSLYTQSSCKGCAAIEALRPIWNATCDSTEELIASTGKDLLPTISEIEEQLEQ